ncbi:biliverdin-producing heme oxygenase [Phenylobacterium sp.]|uniref:biliverdin-producing heme oxygenase n=1 Tax=Phenylobacterium sp. TaxID=1871053 RepID=UPI0025E63B29|nr:biliverdin-producing heme oxygenase [Phenylobacterium sp.]MBX3483817.1 biliverdin-producing heme oxygenase [Phenylobacterium sp.]MCW5759972.1 biliverdin-producing heme oxygenase [Phenylobacterium sp.]
MISDTHRRLRDATHAHHVRLETRIDILNRIATAEGRRELVGRFHALHAAAEHALAPFLAGIDGLDFDARRRSARLAGDLADLGTAPGAPSAPIVVRGVAEALGLMYVLEGSTLGGRVIRKHVESRGGDMRGLSFLDPYGADAGERWRAFLGVLDAEADVEGLVAGAVAGFDHSERHLCGGSAA